MTRPVPDVYHRTRFRCPAPHPAWPARFVVLSAFATTGETWSDARNAEADARLCQELEGRGVWHARVTGYDGGGTHAEPSWAADLAPAVAHELAAAFHQLGLFEVVEDEVWIVLTDPDPGAAPRERLGRWSERLDAV